MTFPTSLKIIQKAVNFFIYSATIISIERIKKQFDMFPFDNNDFPEGYEHFADFEPTNFNIRRYDHRSKYQG